MDIAALLQKFDVPSDENGTLAVFSPIDGAKISTLKEHEGKDVAAYVDNAQAAFLKWRAVPAPVRGEFVRLLGEELRSHKDDLGALVTLECGKLLSEGLGEVQEMIDICDFAVGLSRQLYGLTIASERPGHHMREMWHPLGVVGIISAFNFPVAVWAWNAALALVCGNAILWKPSEKTPVTALACQTLFVRAVEKFKAAGHDIPDGLSQVLVGGADVGASMVDNETVRLVSATGSGRMGKIVGAKMGGDLRRSLLELGGNNALVVAPSADLDLALRAILFGAVGTCGQRCTTTRRLLVHKDIKAQLVDSLVNAYGDVRIGNPLDSNTLVGPLIDEDSYSQMRVAIKRAKEEGGTVLCGGARTTVEGCENGYYVTPAIIEMSAQSSVVQHETFAPILYVLEYETIEQAVEMNNAVPQGLSSAIFTNDVREGELFLSAVGSDCGIANVNIGTSGAEIGGAFGGEKETGGGRESGSDSWKVYMRRQTQTVNYSTELPLAQGVNFDL